MGAVSSVPWLRTTLIAVLVPTPRPAPHPSPQHPTAALPQQLSTVATSDITSVEAANAAAVSAGGTRRFAPAPDTPPPAEATVSLGAGLFGLPAAPGFAVPGDEAPGAWLVLFLECHADEAVFNGLFCTSRGAKAWCLQHAPRARLTLRKHVAWPGKLNAARDDLRVRGALPTCLAIQLPDTPEGRTALADVPGAVAGVGHGITGVQRPMASYMEPEPVRTAFLLSLSPHMPNLTNLMIQSSVLPPPATFPHLRKLGMWGVGLSACPSIAQYLRQITSLTLEPVQIAANAVCSAVFATATSTLTYLEISCDLTDHLLGLLVSRTPALTELKAGPVRVRTNAHMGKEWAVERLYARGDDSTALESIRRLPVRSAGTAITLGRTSLVVSHREVR